MNSAENQDWAEKMNTAGLMASEMDVTLAEATRRMAVADYTGAQIKVSQAHNALGKLGLALADIEAIRVRNKSTSTGPAIGGVGTDPTGQLDAPLTGEALTLMYQLWTPTGAIDGTVENKLRTLLGGQNQLSAAISAYGPGGQYYNSALAAVASMTAPTLAHLEDKYPDPNGPQSWLAANFDQSVVPNSWPGVMAAIGR